MINGAQSAMAVHPNTTEATCTKCGKLTFLKVIMPSFKSDHEERLFECSGCGHSETVFVKL
jgi:ribosomal protein S27AE